MRQEFPNLLNQLNIKYLDIMPYFLNYQSPHEIIHYWDYYFNEKGYKLLSKAISEKFIETSNFK